MKPTFIMLIGISGAGKSTFAERLKDEDTIVLSSDEIRKELFGDENIQENPEKVFSTMFYRTVKALNMGKNVVYDATNVKRKLRVNTLQKIKSIATVDFIAKAIVIDTNLEDAKKRNNSRSRVVPEEVIDRMYNNFDYPKYEEGWDQIEII